VDKQKTLILLTESYPFLYEEFFLDDEIGIIAKRFEKIIIITKEQNNPNYIRHLPSNVFVNTYSQKVTIDIKIFGLLSFSKIFFWKEIFYIIKNFKLKLIFHIFKIMYMDIVKARILTRFINIIVRKNRYESQNIIFYSYWHDYKSLALALLKKENKDFKCISRSHGWDIFFDRHPIPYLPFKKNIVLSLDQTYSISLAGKMEFLRLLGSQFENKISISRLGKTSTRVCNVQKKEDSVLFCSCSFLLPLKRIHLIIDILAQLQFKKIKWVHWGEGELRKELEEYAKQKISHVEFCFKGIVKNSEILEFYHNNYVDLFINVSESEGIPVSIMEALSAGIPIIATDVGGTSEIVNKKFGFLINKEFDVNVIAQVIETYLSSSLENQLHYRQNAFDFWKKSYNADINYNKFADELLGL